MPQPNIASDQGTFLAFASNNNSFHDPGMSVGIAQYMECVCSNIGHTQNPRVNPFITVSPMKNCIFCECAHQKRPRAYG